ncbi:hypothetical protein Bhyg_03770 [Pseudolycoriella hygida]|uniref:PHD-type domain-containing protein n=1 Tax=Pseudolycoriella hygida TaxID=35572 RepID=A0A9Q0NDX4_9DIPT|nr:hypothetical protein Bhyg_03770 [Pseudolycoriella hygida]
MSDKERVAEMESPIEILCEDALLHIFSYLDGKSLKNSALVCKWLKCTSPDHTYDIKDISNFGTFLETQASSLTELDLNYVEPAIIKIIFTKLKVLEKLTIRAMTITSESSFYASFKKMPKLKELILRGDILCKFKEILANCAYLETFSLRDNHFCYLDLDNILIFMAAKNPAVKSLSLDSLPKRISRELKFCHLKFLHVETCETFENLLQFLENNTTVETLSLNLYRRRDIIDDFTFEALLSHPNLRHLVVEGDTFELNRIYDKIKSDYRNLKSIDLRSDSMQDSRALIRFPNDKAQWKPVDKIFKYPGIILKSSDRSEMKRNKTPASNAGEREETSKNVSVRSRGNFTQDVQCIYCNVSQDEGQWYVQCDDCDGYIHFACAGITEISEEDPWSCENCITRAKEILPHTVTSNEESVQPIRSTVASNVTNEEKAIDNEVVVSTALSPIHRETIEIADEAIDHVHNSTSKCGMPSPRASSKDVRSTRSETRTTSSISSSRRRELEVQRLEEELKLQTEVDENTIALKLEAVKLKESRHKQFLEEKYKILGTQDTEGSVRSKDTATTSKSSFVADWVATQRKQNIPAKAKSVDEMYIRTVQRFDEQIDQLNFDVSIPVENDEVTNIRMAMMEKIFERPEYNELGRKFVSWQNSRTTASEPRKLNKLTAPITDARKQNPHGQPIHGLNYETVTTNHPPNQLTVPRSRSTLLTVQENLTENDHAGKMNSVVSSVGRNIQPHESMLSKGIVETVIHRPPIMSTGFHNTVGRTSEQIQSACEPVAPNNLSEHQDLISTQTSTSIYAPKGPYHYGNQHFEHNFLHRQPTNLSTSSMPKAPLIPFIPNQRTKDNFASRSQYNNGNQRYEQNNFHHNSAHPSISTCQWNSSFANTATSQPTRSSIASGNNYRRGDEYYEQMYSFHDPVITATNRIGDTGIPRNNFDVTATGNANRHFSNNCAVAKKLSLDERHKVAERQKACSVCIGTSHQTKSCQMKSTLKCNECGGTHWKLMCKEKPQTFVKSTERQSTEYHSDEFGNDNNCACQ